MIDTPLTHHLAHSYSLMDLLSGLNEPQREAVLHTEGPLLIFAGAGSGKTRTLTHRIAHLMQQGVPPARILAVTFTNKAAREMRERLEGLVGREAGRMWLGTFHALCAKMLRIHGDRIGIDPRFAIFDSDDASRIMKDVLKDANLDTDKYPPARILSRVSDAKNNLLTPEEFTDRATGPYDRAIGRLYARYQERLRAAHGLDFDDIIMEGVRLLRDDELSRAHWSERFLYVLVDEYQDANEAQFKWVQALASNHRNICVVGDDDQSIYGWRGANVKLILEFELTYPDAKIVRLEQNYRSSQNILDAAHGVIARNRSRAPKRLWTQDGEGATLQLHGAANAQEEARWVVDSVRQLQREGREPGEMAILCRVNAQSRPFEEAFVRARVPLRLVGTQRFYDRREIKDLIGYLKVLYNPGDALSLLRIINVPARGIGAATLDKLAGRAEAEGLTLYEVITHPDTPTWLGRPAGTKIGNFARLLSQLQTDADASERVADLLSTIIDRTEYLDFLRREKTLDSLDRPANVEEFLNSAEDFDDTFEEVEAARASEDAEDDTYGEITEGARDRMQTFLENVALEGARDQGDDSGNAVTFMTLHSAKGLEFPVVFLVGLEQGLLPHARALWGESADDTQLEEERRLCYVGLTRAREKVLLSYAVQRTMHGRTESAQPSQFIDEIPTHLLEREGYASLNAPRLSLAATRWDSPSYGSSYGGKGASSGSSLYGRAAAATTRPTPPRVPTEPEPPTKVAAAPPKFQVGDRVQHPSWGEGLVIGSHGSGRSEVVEVAFLSREFGKKRLATSHAKLEKI